MENQCDQHMLHISDCLDQHRALPTETESHIKQCSDCAEFLHLWTEDSPLNQMASRKQDTGSDPQLTETILTQIEFSPEKSTARKPSWISFTAAAAIILGITVWSTRSPDHQPAPAPTIVEENGSIDFSLKLPSLEGDELSKGITDLSIASTEKVSQTGKRITRVTQKIHFLTTRLSELIPVITEPEAPQGSLPQRSSQTT